MWIVRLASAPWNSTSAWGMQIADMHDHARNHNLTFSVRVPLQSPAPAGRRPPRVVELNCRNEDGRDPVAQEIVR